MGTLFFNKGRGKTLHSILDALGHHITDNMSAQWAKMDSKKIRKQVYQKGTPTKKRRKVHKRRNIKNIQTFSHEEGTMYKSANFHGGESSKKPKEAKGKVRKGK